MNKINYLRCFLIIIINFFLINNSLVVYADQQINIENDINYNITYDRNSNKVFPFFPIISTDSLLYLLQIDNVDFENNFINPTIQLEENGFLVTSTTNTDFLLIHDFNFTPKLLRTLFYVLDDVKEFKLNKEIYYFLNSDHVNYCHEYDQSQKLIKTTYYSSFYNSHFQPQIEYINLYDENTNLIKQIYYFMDFNHDIACEIEYNKNLIKQKIYAENNKNDFVLKEIYPDKKLITNTYYSSTDVNKIECIEYYDENEMLIKQIFYQPDGLTIDIITEYLFGKLLNRQIFYREDGINIRNIKQFNEEGKLITNTFYSSIDKDKIAYIAEYDQKALLTQIKYRFYFVNEPIFDNVYDSNGKFIKTIVYQKDSTNIDFINEYDEYENLTKVIFYKEDGKNFYAIKEYGKNKILLKEIYYQTDNRKIDFINEYQSNGIDHKLIRQIIYKLDSYEIDKIEEFDNDEISSNTLYFFYNAKAVVDYISEYDKDQHFIRNIFYLFSTNGTFIEIVE